MTRPDPAAVLAVPMRPGNGAGAATLRDWLVAVLGRVWEQGPDFSSKRPFGLSTWAWEPRVALIDAGMVAGTFDADGDVEECDTDTADRLVADAIRALGGDDDGKR